MKRWAIYAAALAAVLAGPGLSRAAPQDELAPVLACAGETDAVARLACYDAAVARMRKGPAPVAPAAALAAAPAPTAAPTLPAATATPAPTTPSSPELSPEERFGLRGELRKEKTGEISVLTATATAISAKPRGELVVTLDNGQVWAEIAPGSKIRVKPGDAVKIEAGSLDSYFLIAPNGRSSRVSRIR